MSALKYERMRELEVALALKQREIDSLHVRCDEFRSVQQSALNGLVGQCLSNNSCNEALAAVPFEQVQNAVAQLNAQKLHEEKAAKIFDKTTSEIELAIQEHEKEQLKLNERMEYLKSLTGLDTQEASKRVAKMNKKAEEAARVRAEAGFGEGAMVAVETNQSRALAASMLPIEIRLQYKQLEGELHAIEVLKYHNKKVIASLSARLEKKADLKSKRCDILACVRSCERELVIKKATLKELVREHESVDQQTDKLRQSEDHACKAILDKDATTLRGRLDECVERRRLQERVTKAQQLRMNQLTGRIKVVQDALVRHGLDKEVDMRIAEAERESARTQGANGLGGLITLPEDEEQAFYDVDSIVPVDETIHPAIYSLFVEDKQRLERRARTQAVMLQEKMEALEAMEAKLADLAVDVDKDQDKLHHITMENERELNEMKRKIEDDLLKQREDYCKIMGRGRTAQSKMAVSRDRASSAQPKRPTWSVSGTSGVSKPKKV